MSDVNLNSIESSLRRLFGDAQALTVSIDAALQVYPTLIDTALSPHFSGPSQVILPGDRAKEINAAVEELPNGWDFGKLAIDVVNAYFWGESDE